MPDDVNTVGLTLLVELPPGEEPPPEVPPLDLRPFFGRFGQFTRLHVTHFEVARSRCAQLSAAAAAYDEGRPDLILHAHRRPLGTVGGQRVSLPHAKILHALADTLEAPWRGTLPTEECGKVVDVIGRQRRVPCC